MGSLKKKIHTKLKIKTCNPRTNLQTGKTVTLLTFISYVVRQDTLYQIGNMYFL